MKVLLCHNYYQQTGGEDLSFRAEADLLAAHGHEVVQYTRHNDDIEGSSRWATARQTFWNRRTYRQVRALIRRERPQIMHCTNTFPLISPAVFYAARAEKVPVVAALRNYRLLCPAWTLLRQGRVCEDCLGRAVAWPAVVHGCYRGSRTGSAVVAGMLAGHRVMKTWSRTVDMYFTLTQFARSKFLEAGFPPERIAVKPNFIDPDPGPGRGGGAGADGYAVFVGRLSEEKGIHTLLHAWDSPSIGLPLKIIGDGPLAQQVRARAAATEGRIDWLGTRSPQQVLAIIGDATCLVMTSIWYETFGRTVIEAFAKGTPVIASRLGAMAELVDDGRTGLLFEPADAEDLRAKVQLLLAEREKIPCMRRAARHEYEQKYTARINYQILLDIYAQARLRADTANSLAHGARRRVSMT